MTNYKELYQINDVPLFQNMVYDSYRDSISCSRGNVRLVQNLETGLIYNDAFDYSVMNYDSNYQNEQGFSEVFKQHLNEVLGIVKNYFSEFSLIEVGCGKGVFLEILKSNGFNVLGCDPAYEGDNPLILKEYFSPQSNIKVDGIILRHTLEHIINPYEFLLSLKETNGSRGLIYIEVPCFDWICSRKTWFDIFYEHVNYFRIGDFYRLFDKVYEAKKTFGGQYLSIVADLSSLREPVFEDILFEFPSDFNSGIIEITHRLREMKTDSDSKIVVWGGASKGVIFSLLMKRNQVQIDSVVDINPVKKDKYLPLTGLKVIDQNYFKMNYPSNTIIVITNSNYKNEIELITENKYQYITID